MKEFKYTEGPWCYKDDNGMLLAEETEWSADFNGSPLDGTSFSFPVMAGGKTVALVVGEGWDESETQGNAALIEAAPRMFAALNECLEFMRHECNTYTYVERHVKLLEELIKDIEK